MRPLTIKIPGHYWDSQLYSGRLYLFQRDGSVRTVDWDRLVRRWELDAGLRVAIECAFRRSDYLYQPELKLFFSDPEVGNVIKRKLLKLAGQDLEVSREALDSVTMQQETNRFPFPHTDSAIYGNNMYVSAKEGVFRAHLGRSRSEWFDWLEGPGQRKG